MRELAPRRSPGLRVPPARPPRPAGLRALLVVLVLALLACASACTTVRADAEEPLATATPLPRPQLGVLLADPRHLAVDKAAGITVATVELQWRDWQPQAGATASAYVKDRVADVEAYRRAGYRVAVDLGLQYAPPWVLSMPDGQLRDQHGGSSGTADLVFNASVRRAAETYLDAVVPALGEVWSYRLGLSGQGEALYPDASRGQWWAFGDIAQGRRGGRVTTTAAAPLPGWVPGSSTLPSGATITTAQVRTWYDWYLGASVNALAWEMRALRRTGTPALLQLLVPGTGANEYTYSHRISAHLAEVRYDAFHTMNTAAVWWQVLERFPARSGIAVTVTSVWDRSGVPRGSACVSADRSLSLQQAGAQPWSSTRWLSYLAGHFGYPHLLGESTGNNSPADAAPTYDLARACRVELLSWAWDYQLQDGVHASLADLEAAAAR